MSQVKNIPTRTYHATLPHCVSSFNDHAGCQGTINTATSVIKCDCEPCHGKDARPEAICAGCHASMPVVVHDNALPVGERIAVSRSTGRYCDACRAEFLQDMKGAGVRS